MTQLLLFEEPRDLEKEVDKLKMDYEKLRKSLFQRLSDQNKKYQELSHDYEVMKMNLCRGKIIL